MTSIKNTAITFYGNDTADLTVYTAKYLKELGKKVAIVDFQDEIISYFDTEGPGVFTIQENIDIYCAANYSEERKKAYDVRIYNAGTLNLKDSIKEQCLNILVTNLEKKQIDELKAIIKLNSSLKEASCIRFYRDVVSSKLTETFLNKELMINELTVNIVTELDKKILQEKIHLQHYGEINLRKLPEHFRQALKSVIKELLYEEDPRELDKQLKKAEKGRAIWQMGR